MRLPAPSPSRPADGPPWATDAALKRVASGTRCTTGVKRRNGLTQVFDLVSDCPLLAGAAARCGQPNAMVRSFSSQCAQSVTFTCSAPSCRAPAHSSGPSFFLTPGSRALLATRVHSERLLSWYRPAFPGSHGCAASRALRIDNGQHQRQTGACSSSQRSQAASAGGGGAAHAQCGLAGLTARHACGHAEPAPGDCGHDCTTLLQVRIVRPWH